MCKRLAYTDIEPDQLDCIEFINSGEDSLICADVGTGKTVISLTAAIHSLKKGEVKRWLVLAPLLVATDTWALEAVEWEHLKGTKVDIACGNENERLDAIGGTAPIVVMNYENLAWLMERYPKPRKGKPDPFPFDGLICDEIDKLKDVSSNRFKSFRNRIGVFNKRIGLTGTLLPNRLEEVWGQMFIVDGGASFSEVKTCDGGRIGRSFYAWRKHFFYPTDYNQRNWKGFPDTRQIILDKLKGLAYRMKAKGLPEVVMVEPYKMQLPETVRDHYYTLETQFYLALEDEKGRTREVDAANSAVLSGKLQQICAGFSYVDKGKEVVWHSLERFEWLWPLYASCCKQGEQLLVFYHFNAELDMLRSKYPTLKWLGKGINNLAARKNIAEWNRGELPMMALHPGSAGHGLNLQKSNAHHIAFLTMPWSGGMFKQVVGRLARRGNKAKKIYVHTALFENTVDIDVYDAVTGKMSRLESFLDDLGG